MVLWMRINLSLAPWNCLPTPKHFTAKRMISRTHANTHTLSIHPIAASVTWEHSNLAHLVPLLPPKVSSAPGPCCSWRFARSCTCEWTAIKSIKVYILSRSLGWDRGIGRQAKQHSSKRNRAQNTCFTDKTAHHLMDQSCRKLLASSSLLPCSLKTQMTRQHVFVQLKASFCTCKERRKTTLFTGMAHANKHGLHFRCTHNAQTALC